MFSWNLLNSYYSYLTSVSNCDAHLAESLFQTCSRNQTMKSGWIVEYLQIIQVYPSDQLQSC
ncbi:DUF6783 domain-containing protein [Ruminococcus sp. RTP21484sp1_RTP21281st1_A2_RTP21281_210402]|uniref:DUF6783 domain-containing protein n=1 Tax=unclassified Ruminococcus TaxID=2608920 RepID=UPI0034A355B0